MKWILLIAWAANGTGYTTQEFDTQKSCMAAKEWVKENDFRGGQVRTICMKKGDA